VGAEQKKGHPRRFLEGHDPAGTEQLGNRAQSAHRIRKKLENEAADYGVERLVVGELSHIGLDEVHMVVAGLSRTRPGAGNGSGIAFYPHHLARGANELAHQEGYVPHAGAEIQDALTWAKAGLAEEPFGEWSDTRRLSNEALVLRIGIAKDVIQ
jgi:hypothetical protein